MSPSACWVFGYGSLIWRPDFAFLEQRPAHVRGWVRRFWQGSHDHRGTPDAPGRVVTLVPDANALCMGTAYRVDGAVLAATFEALDYREKNGYGRVELPLYFADGGGAGGLLYVAPLDNPAYLGPAPLAAMAAQIATRRGPSGANRDYLFALAAALRALGVGPDDEPHVFTLERAVREAMAE